VLDPFSCRTKDRTKSEVYPQLPDFPFVLRINQYIVHLALFIAKMPERAGRGGEGAGDGDNNGGKVRQTFDDAASSLY
jgi:hypothetical protein